MEASNTPAQSGENQEQSRPFTTEAALSNPGAFSLFNPYAAAAVSGVASPAQFSPFTFSPHRFAALLGGGFPSATPAVQQTSDTVYNKALPSTAVSAMSSPLAVVQSMPSAAVAAAAAQVVAAHAASASSGAMANNAVFANMQDWNLDQLGTY